MSGIIRADVLAICDRDEYRGIGIAVETGTFEGATARMLRTVFPVVVTIELEPSRWRRVCVGGEGIVYLLGDSVHLVPLISKAYQGEPVFWFLDAHWFSRELGSDGEFGLPVADENPCPLWAELLAISRRTQRDVVVVDDVHAFGRKDSEYSRWEGVSVSSLDAFLGSRLVESKVIGDIYVAYLS